MNRVQTVTQKYHRVENQFEKPSRMHKHPAGPADTPRCALAARGRSYRGRVLAVSWPGAGRIVGASAPCRGVCALSCAPRPCAVSWLPSDRVAARKRPYRKPCRAPLAVSWACVRVGMAVSWPVSRHTAQPQAPFLSQYNLGLAIQSPAKPTPLAIQIGQ